jgi:hypothetical protein
LRSLDRQFECRGCGAETHELALVFDPWLDCWYGICVECIASIHKLLEVPRVCVRTQGMSDKQWGITEHPPLPHCPRNKEE